MSIHIVFGNWCVVCDRLIVMMCQKWGPPDGGTHCSRICERD